MSLDDDYFELRGFLESFENVRDRECMIACLGRINDYNNQVAEEIEEVVRQLAALKAAIVVKEGAGVKITQPSGEGRYIHLELKQLTKDKETI